MYEIEFYEDKKGNKFIILHYFVKKTKKHLKRKLNEQKRI